MIRIRPYRAKDADTIISWCQDEKEFYQWTAGVMGEYPITNDEFAFVENLMPFIAFDKNGVWGFFTFRNPSESIEELRMGFVIVNPSMRGSGYGKAMIQQALKYAFEIYGAKRVSLGVFENNAPAYYCYKAVGFEDVILDHTETYSILGEKWKCKELKIEKR